MVCNTIPQNPFSLEYSNYQDSDFELVFQNEYEKLKISFVVDN